MLLHVCALYQVVLSILAMSETDCCKLYVVIDHIDAFMPQTD